MTNGNEELRKAFESLNMDVVAKHPQAGQIQLWRGSPSRKPRKASKPQGWVDGRTREGRVLLAAQRLTDAKRAKRVATLKQGASMVALAVAMTLGYWLGDMASTTFMEQAVQQVEARNTEGN